MSDNFCDANGWVVGGGHQVPPAPFDYSWGVQGPVIGCNNLRCRSCNQVVRNAGGHTWTKQTMTRLADIYSAMGAPDSATALAALVSDDALATEASARMYTCGCNVHVEQDQRALGEDADWDHDEGPSWTCAGHPQLSLPATIDGVDLANDIDADAIVAAHLVAPAPAGAPAFTADYASAWVHRLLHVLSHEAIAASLGNAIATRLTHDDASIRGAAVDVFRRDPMASGGEGVVDALRDHADLYTGVANPHSDRPLDEWLQVAVGHRAAAGDTSALTALQGSVLQGGEPTMTTLRSLAGHASTWLASHAADVLRAHPSRNTARRLLDVMAKALGDELVDSAIAMGAADAVDRTMFLDLVRQLVRDERAERIRDGLS